MRTTIGKRRFMDGTANQAVGASVVVIEDGQIVAVGEVLSISRPRDGVETSDAGGEAILPSVIDCHDRSLGDILSVPG